MRLSCRSAHRAAVTRSTRGLRPLASLTLLVVLLLPAAAAPGPEVLFSPNGGVRQRLLRAIQESQRTIDVAVFHITVAELAEALSTAAGRGVRVRVLTDRSKGESSALLRRLRRTGLAVRLLGVPEQSLMHHKFAVFDGRLVATGSYNWTHSAERVNAENLLVLDEAEVVDRFRQEFERLWREATE